MTYKDLYALLMQEEPDELILVGFGKTGPDELSYVLAKSYVEPNPEKVWFLESKERRDDGSYELIWVSWDFPGGIKTEKEIIC